MKIAKGFSVAALIICVTAVALIGIGAYLVIDGNNKATDFDDYNFYSIIEPDENNGNIGDHVKGSKDAPALIFEYADYQCPGCASINPRVNKAVEKADGKLAIVYRSFLLSYHKNGTAAASAAEAAGLQGYWKAFADKLFAEQENWEEASPSERTAIFNDYFIEVTEGKGDIDKFNQDLASKDISKKINFDMGIGRRVNVSSTPAFFVDGQEINWSEAGEVVVNGKTISWDSGRAGDDFVKLLVDIAEAKASE